MNKEGKASGFLVRNWLGVLGLAVGIGGIVLSIYFFYGSIAEREPVFLIDPVKTTIVDSKLFQRTSLKVSKSDNTPVNADVSSLRFYFWNRGKLAIKPDNVLQPLILSLTDQNGEILDYKLLQTSRPDIVQADIVPDASDRARNLRLNFKILEKNDGFTGQIIFSGDTYATLAPSGVIEGAGRIAASSDALHEILPRWLLIIQVLLSLLSG